MARPLRTAGLDAAQLAEAADCRDSAVGNVQHYPTAAQAESASFVDPSVQCGVELPIVRADGHAHRYVVRAARPVGHADLAFGSCHDGTERDRLRHRTPLAGARADDQPFVRPLELREQLFGVVAGHGVGVANQRWATGRLSGLATGTPGCCQQQPCQQTSLLPHRVST